MRLHLTVLCSAALLTASVNVEAQTNNAIVINQGAAAATVVSPTGEIFINGVSSKEDIGGVEISRGKYKGYQSFDLQFVNYNEFPVNVLYLVNAYSEGQRMDMTGSIVLQPGETKFSRDSYADPLDYRMIVRRMNTRSQSAEGAASMPAPKRQKQDLDGVLEKYGNYFYAYPEKITCRFKNIQPFIDNLNSKRVYGRSNWRLANAIEVKMVCPQTWRLYASSETRPSYNDPWDKEYNFIIVCE